MGVATARARTQTSQLRAIEGGKVGVTLLELVEAVGEVTDDENEIIATVQYMLTSGTISLRGNFRDTDPEDFC